MGHDPRVGLPLNLTSRVVRVARIASGLLETGLPVHVSMRAYFRNIYQALRTVIIGMRITLKYA